MRIACKNFRCHRDAVFEIPDTGLILLSGTSGAGKSSVLAAFVYALYGKLPGKMKRPYTNGTKSCSVELDYMGMHIVRTKPKSVTVEYEEVTYEDSSAQGIIEQTVGCNFTKFMASSYIVQKHNISVLSMTPTEQLRFIEKLVFNDDYHITFRENVKAEIKRETENKLKMIGEIEVRKQQLSEEEAQYETEPDIPSEITDGYIPDDVRKEVAALEKRLTNLNKKMLGSQKLTNGLSRIIQMHNCRLMEPC